MSLTALLIATLDPGVSLWALLLLWLASTGILVAFGAQRLRKLVVRPLDALGALADRLAAGETGAAAPRFATEELDHLRERFANMAAQLIEARDQAVRAEKLAAIGQLAAGVAHEIRNPLGAFNTYLEVLERRGTDPAVLEAMRGEAARIERTVRSLLDFARPGAPTGATDLNDAVEHTIRFLDAQGALRDIALATDLEPGLPPVRGDRHQLEQVVVNLVLNARDAAAGGTVQVGTRAQAYDPGADAGRRAGDPPGAPPTARAGVPKPRRPDLAPGTPGVLLFVRDDGPGVPDALRERIFDPFVTTKGPGEGTGLGLALVARAVHDAGGVVWVDRGRERGAVFKVFLPAEAA